MAGDRCPWAIRFGTTLTTRCALAGWHMGAGARGPQEHVGRGLRQFPYQRIEWFAGDRREFLTERDDGYAWEDEAPA